MINSLRILAFLLLMSVFGFMYILTYTQTFDSYIPFFFNQISTSRTISPKDILSQGNGIIFIETTDRLKPSPIVLCAIESAARVYNDRPVVFFMKGLSNITTEDDENRIRKNFSTLSAYENVYFFPLKMEEVFHNTPLLPWYLKLLVKTYNIPENRSAVRLEKDSKIVDPKLERHWVHVSSDGCRLALIWKHGGIYMDTDIISIRQIPDKDFLAAQSSQYSSNGVFGLSVDHDFCWKSMENFVQNYNGDAWGHQGPGLFTRVLKQYCTLPAFKSLEDIMCGNISFLNPQRFYPISYPSWRLYYSVWEKLPTFNDSYALHLWNYMNDGKMSVIPGSNTLVDHLYQQYCPNTYESLKGNKTKTS